MKELFLLRGLPGSGKSTLAKALGGEQVEADQYFIVDGEYRFDPTKIKTAHEWCRSQVSDWMFLEFERIVVSNTFTQEWEMEPYFQMAKEKGYMVFSLVVENRHGGENVHGVPAEKLQQMKNRFEFKL